MRPFRAFGREHTHGMLARPSVQGVASSEGRGWSSLYASTQVEHPFAGTFDPVDDHLIVWHRNGPVEIEGNGGGGDFRHTVPANGLHLIPGGGSFSIRLAGRLSTMHVYVRRSIMQQVARDLAEAELESITLRAGVLEADSLLLAMLRPIEMAIDGKRKGGLCADYLAHALAAHLIERHSDARLHSKPGDGARNLSSLAKTAAAFVRNHLDQTITLADIATATDRSVSCISRLFLAEFGASPHRYVMQQRVEHARKLLGETTRPIAQIAFECGFTHQEHLTRHFKRQYDVTPARFRKSSRPSSVSP